MEPMEPIIKAASRNRSGLDDSYRMIRLLGRGTMSSVYLAEQVSMARPIALKILSPALARDPAFVERFLREAKVFARLNHPNIVTAIDFGEVDNRFYLAMEYVDGESLAQMIEREAPIDERRVLAIGHQVILALEHAAKHNVIHRDVKPANILICKDGRVKLTDFGLAILADAPGMAEASRRAVGTPYYMAPEQLEGGKIDWRADQCSLGASLYEAVTGIKPFSGKSVSDILTRRLMDTPNPAWRVSRSASRGFSAVLSKMMARSPDNRYQNFADLKHDFDRLAAGKRPTNARLTETTRTILRSSSGGLRTMGKTVVRERLDNYAGSRKWNVLLIVSGVLVLMLALYALSHWDELAGPRPAVRNGLPKFQERNVDFHKYRFMRDAWATALRLKILAERLPNTNTFKRAREALQYIVDDGEFAETVYETMAKRGLTELSAEEERWLNQQEKQKPSGTS